VLVLVIVLAIVVVLALLIGLGGFGGYGGPTVYRRIIYRRPVRRVVTEHRIVDAAGPVDPVDDPVYRP
jgi:hypothetical protein